MFSRKALAAKKKKTRLCVNVIISTEKNDPVSFSLNLSKYTDLLTFWKLVQKLAHRCCLKVVEDVIAN